MTFKHKSQVGKGTICTPRGRNGKIWSDSIYILRVEPVDFADRSNVQREREEKLRMMPSILMWANRRMQLTFTELRKFGVGGKIRNSVSYPEGSKGRNKFGSHQDIDVI